MGHFESRAAASYAESSKDIEQLLSFHTQLGGTGPGRRWYVGVLNKSAIVLLCAVWEAYCEDLADEALRHILAASSDPSKLPKILQKRVAKELREDRNELSPWKLAGDSWKGHVQGRLTDLRHRRNFDWNSPRASNVEKLFEEVVGIPKVTDAWYWRRTAKHTAIERLEKFVALRGDIAHRGSPTVVLERATVQRAVNLVNLLVAKTDAKVTKELERMTGVKPWAAEDPKPRRRNRPATNGRRHRQGAKAD